MTGFEVMSDRKILLLDCDGSITSSKEGYEEFLMVAVRETCIKIFKEADVYFDEDKFNEIWYTYLGQGIPNYLNQYINHHCNDCETAILRQICLNDEQMLDYFATVHTNVTKALQDNNINETHYPEAYNAFGVRDGIKDLITHFRKNNNPTAIISNTHTRFLLNTLKAGQIGLTKKAPESHTIVDTIIGRTEIEESNQRKKSAPDGYLWACEIHQINPKNAIGIEDSLAGYKALLSAGIGFRIFCDNTGNDIELLAGMPQPHLIVQKGENIYQAYLAAIENHESITEIEENNYTNANIEEITYKAPIRAPIKSI